MATTIPLTDDLRAEYDRLYAEADISDGKEPVVSAAAQKIIAHWPRYETVAATIGCPPHLVALIHSLESDCDFSTHLHNGDPLAARTTHVPAGRPVSGDPPYTWEASAIDALRYHSLDKWADWSIAGLCYVLERYNGWGYRKYHPTTKSPYLWACTSIYAAGKYVSDGKWSSTAVSQQVGAVALLMEIARQGHPFPVVQEVAHASSNQDVATALSQSASSGMPAYSLLPVGDSQAVVKAVDASLSGSGAVTAQISKLIGKNPTTYGAAGLFTMLVGNCRIKLDLWIFEQHYTFQDASFAAALVALGVVAWGLLRKQVQGAQ